MIDYSIMGNHAHHLTGDLTVITQHLLYSLAIRLNASSNIKPNLPSATVH